MGFFSLQENRCGLCRVTFDRESAYQQHVDRVHANIWWKALIPLLLLAVAAGIYYYVSVIRPSMTINPDNYTGAEMGEHWHASYSVEVCGETKQPFLYSQGDVHTHGNGKIHIHPHSADSTGPAANLQAFVSSVGGSMTDTSLVIPGWGIDSSDGCGNKPGDFNVYVNGYRLERPTEYTPQEGDSVRFVIKEGEGDPS